MIRQTITCFCVALLSALLLPQVSFGGFITFQYEGVGSGSIGGQGFSEKAFVITAAGDTADRQAHLFGFFIVHTTASITIDQMGTYDFLVGSQSTLNQSSRRVVFERTNPPDPIVSLFVGPRDESLATWDMTTSIGPLSGDGWLYQWALFDINTSGGNLVFEEQGVPGWPSEDNPVASTFTARVETTAVPEPTGLAIWGLGLALIASRVLRRR